MKLKALTDQIRKWITQDRYPSAYIPVNLWVWHWDKNGNCKYEHFATLINYIKNHVA